MRMSCVRYTANHFVQVHGTHLICWCVISCVWLHWIKSPISSSFWQSCWCRLVQVQQRIYTLRMIQLKHHWIMLPYRWSLWWLAPIWLQAFSSASIRWPLTHCFCVSVRILPIQIAIVNLTYSMMSFYWFLRSFLAIFSGRLWKEWWLRRQTIFHVETIDEDSWQKECHTTWSI